MCEIRKDNTFLSLVNFQLIDLYLLMLLFVAPILLLLANKEWFFAPPGWLDPFVYVGYFLHWDEHLPFWENYYKISRLPWILSGNIACKLFSPLFAHYFLHLFYFYANLFSLYFTTKYLLDRKSAFIASAALCFYIFFHGSGGWGYHNSACSAYYILAFLLITYASALRNRFFLIFLGGSLFGCSLHTNNLMLFLFPIIFIHWLLLSEKKIKSIVLFILSFGAGIIAITIILCLISYLTGGQFLFYKPQYEFTKYAYGQNYTSVWKLVFQNCYWLVFPVFILLSSIITIIFYIILTIIKRTNSITKKTTFFLISYFIILAIIIILGQSRGVPLITPDYMLYFAIVPHMFFALGSIIYLSNDKPLSGLLNLKTLGIISIVIFAFPLIFYSKDIYYARLYIAKYLKIETWHIIIPFSIGMLGISFIMISRISRYFIIPALFLVSISNAMLMGDIRIYSISGEYRHRQYAYEAIIECDRIASKADTTLTTRFWFDPNEIINTEIGQISTAYIYHSFVSTRGWQGNLLTGWKPDPGPVRLPEVMIIKGDLDHLGESKKIGILSKDGKYLETMLMKLKGFKVDSRVILDRKISKGPVSFYLQIIEIIDIVDPDSREKDQIISYVLFELNHGNYNNINIIKYDKVKEGKIYRILKKISGVSRISFAVFKKISDPFINKKEIIIKGENSIVFRPSTIKNHLATDFVEIKSSNMKENLLYLKIYLSKDPDTDKNCVVLVQDQNLNTIFELQQEDNSYSTEDIEIHIKISKDVESIRICMHSKDNNQVYLPESILLEQILK